MTTAARPAVGRGREDRGRLTRGGGRYVADLASQEAVSVGFVRSTIARGRLGKVDLSEVRAHEGVIAAYDAKDLAGLVSPLPVRFGPGKLYDWQLLALDWVSFVGEPIALVAGVDRGVVEEACELASVDYEPLVPLIDVEQSASSPELVRPETGSNVVFAAASETGDLEEALGQAVVVVERRFHLARQSACPLENRGVLAYEEPLTGDLVVSTSTQVPHILRQAVATVLKRPEQTVRVLVPDVGGGFGLKCQVAAEECLVAWLAHHLGRRAAWVEDRWENLVASNHAHDESVTLRVGFTSSGTITAVDAEVTVDVGAHSSYPLSVALEPSSTSGHLFGCYKMRAARIVSRGVATNKCATGAYRGVGASVAAFATERILDEAAAELGIDRIEMRRRNLIGRADVPYEHPIGGVLDSGDPLGVFERLISLAGADVGREPAGQTGRDGVLVGTGIAVFTEHSGPGSAVYRRRGVTEVPGYDAARVVMRDDGTFVIYISSADAGQRHAAICRQHTAEALGVDPRLVEVVEGDTASCPKGTGTFASRFAVAQMSAAVTAARRVSERLLEASAAYLKCPPDEVQQAEGGFEHRPSGSAVSLGELARWLYYPEGARAGRSLEVPFEELGYWDGGPALPCGAMMAFVEVDPDSLITRVKRIVTVEECGRVLDREAVLGQLRGGLLMGIGDALLEEHVYSDSGEILTASFMDYLLPTFTEMPEIEIEIYDDASLYTTRSETGSKGVGEAGTIGAVCSIGCAVSDAISGRGAYLDELPATPLRLFGSLGRAAAPQGIGELERT